MAGNGRPRTLIRRIRLRGVPTRIMSWVRRHPIRSALLVGFVVIVLTARQGAWLEGMYPDAVQAYLGEHPVSTPIAFVVVYAVSVMLMLPTLPLNLAAGFLWGSLWGGLFAIIGSSVGAIGAFVLARRIFGQPLQRQFQSPLLTWLKENLQRNGWKIVAFVRMNPVFPGPVNFVFGLTSVRFLTYAWSTPVFLTPPTFFFAYVGSAVNRTFIGQGTPTIIKEVAMISLGLTVFAGLALWARYQMAPVREN